jgi:hypothetical protein
MLLDQSHKIRYIYQINPFYPMKNHFGAACSSEKMAETGRMLGSLGVLRVSCRGFFGFHLAGREVKSQVETRIWNQESR